MKWFLHHPNLITGFLCYQYHQEIDGVDIWIENTPSRKRPILPFCCMHAPVYAESLHLMLGISQRFSINQLYANALKKSENIWFSWAFRGYRKRSATWDGLSEVE